MNRTPVKLEQPDGSMLYYYTQEQMAEHAELCRTIDVTVAREIAESRAKKQAWNDLVNNVNALLVADVTGGDHPWYSAARRAKPT